MKDSLNEENSSLGFIEAVINGNEDKVIFSGFFSVSSACI